MYWKLLFGVKKRIKYIIQFSRCNILKPVNHLGIHYIGKFGHHTINKTLMDQICEGQVEVLQKSLEIF